MPRPVRERNSLPIHSKAVKQSIPSTQPINSNPFESAETLESTIPVVRPPTKQTKSDKAYQKRSALLAKITEGTNPYSKSHNRRTKRAERPSEHLVTSLDTVVDVLAQIDDQKTDENPTPVTATASKVDASKGKEKLTGKKRQRVLVEEALRMPNVMANPAFSTDPFATIRLHTLNTMERFELTAKKRK